MKPSLLGTPDQKQLLNIARTSIETIVRGGKLAIAEPSSPALREKRGAFVTVYEMEELRGCIGYISAQKNLAETVQDAAVHAAMDDPRFESVTTEELAALTIEISVLSEPKQISDVNEIIIGEHGLIIESSGRRGLLLPKVPLEYNWDREKFLKETSIKAGGQADLWKRPNSKIFIFTADVFTEETPKGSA